MATSKTPKVGNSGAEEKFIELFCEAFGEDIGEYVYPQYPFVDIYGKHRTIDYAVNTEDNGKIAFEIDGETWHNPGKVSEDKYTDDLLKQNCIVYNGWKIYRWTDTQINSVPERVRDELVTFLGFSPEFKQIDDNNPSQNGKVFQLMEHQSEALNSLAEMREKGETIALVQGATGSGKSAIGVFDAKSVGKRTLFIAHTKELVNQGYENFRKHWFEVSVGRYVDEYHESDEYVVCASVQSVIRNLDKFKSDDFGYLIIDECHHASADSYKKILNHFNPDFILGLTATPERADGEDLLEIFKNVAHKLDVKDAVEKGVLAPVRCIRVKTNIDLTDVRINGFTYNALDLETKMMIPSRNQLIVDTYMEYVKDKATVIFCTSVNHAEIIANLLKVKGIKAESVSGKTNKVKRKQILFDYENNKIQVLCACDLLNEGWDSPHTEVLFMARPTMSKTIYLQQLGRGMRTYAGKEFLMVFDFVDNANMFNAAYTAHTIFGLTQYLPGGYVVAPQHKIDWDNAMFSKGIKPAAYIDYPVHAVDYELIDAFNWQEKSKGMLSQTELTRRVNVQSETVERYIRDGKIKADYEVPISEHHVFRFFNPERIDDFCKEFGWKKITKSEKKKMFLDMAKQMQMSKSYKPVFLLSFIQVMNGNMEAMLDDIADLFAEYYENRRRNGLLVEKGKCIFTAESYTAKDVEKLILNMPFKRFEDMDFMHHSKHLGIIQLDKAIAKSLTDEDIESLMQYSEEALKKYYGE